MCPSPQWTFLLFSSLNSNKTSLRPPTLTASNYSSTNYLNHFQWLHFIQHFNWHHRSAYTLELILISLGISTSTTSPQVQTMNTYQLEINTPQFFLYWFKSMTDLTVTFSWLYSDCQWSICLYYDVLNALQVQRLIYLLSMPLLYLVLICW